MIKFEKNSKKVVLKFQDNCWTAACLNRDCSKEAKPAAPGSGPISELDRMKAKFLRYCPGEQEISSSPI